MGGWGTAGRSIARHYTWGVQPAIAGSDFVFKIEGKKLTGTARVDAWPGNGVITEGTFDGEKIAFTVLTEDNSTSGPQKLVYAGTLYGDEIALTMRWELGRDWIFETKSEGKRSR